MLVFKTTMPLMKANGSRRISHNRARIRPASCVDSRGRVLGELIAGITLIALSFIALVCYTLRFTKEPRTGLVFPSDAYDVTPMQTAMRPENVEGRQNEVLKLGSRFTGQTGFYATEAFMAKAYQEAGLEVMTQELRTAVPVTEQREIYFVETGSGNEAEEIPIPDVEIFPFMPNYLQPSVTPENGISGELVILTPETLRTRDRFDDCIGLLDTRSDQINSSYGFRWTTYARLGVKALIVAHPEGFEKIPWTSVAGRKSGLVSSAPVNYVRVAATRGIFRHEGKTIRLRVRVAYQNTPNRTLVGVLRAGQKAREALVIFSSYGATSILPDRAPGTLQALGPAVQLQLLRGLLPYRETLARDLFFVSSGSRVMAEDGTNNLIRVLQTNAVKGSGSAISPNPPPGYENEALSIDAARRMTPLLEDREDNARQIQNIESILPLFEVAQFLVDADVTGTLVKELNRRVREDFRDQVEYVLDTIVFEKKEPLLEARLQFLRDPGLSTQDPIFLRYQERRRDYERAMAASGYRPSQLIRAKPDFVQDQALRDRVFARLLELKRHHEMRADQISGDLRIVRALSDYENIGILEAKLASALEGEGQTEALSFDTGTVHVETDAFSILSVLSAARRRIGTAEEKIEIPSLSQTQYERVAQNLGPVPNYAGRMWTNYGYASHTFVNFDRRGSYNRFHDPVDVPSMRQAESLQHTLAVLGEALLSMAHGAGRIGPVTAHAGEQRAFNGRVLASNVGRAMVPDYPLHGAVIAGRPKPEDDSFSYPGHYAHSLVMTDVYGDFNLPYNSSRFIAWETKNYNPIAATYGEDGLINYMKDEGEEGQRLFKSIDLGKKKSATKDITIVTFRASPMALIDLINPQTLKDYSAVSMIDSDGMSRVRKLCNFRDPSIDVTFLEPDEHVFVELQAGAVDNELVQVTRAFMLGPTVELKGESGKDIEGSGFLVADHPLVLAVPHKVAESMASVNDRRLKLQNRFTMADKRTNDHHDRMLANLKRAESENAIQQEGIRYARKANVYGILNHPVLRESVFEAIISILWYLALLVPFVFFFEKLVFCHPDIRKQLVSQAAIFLVIFALLRILHPAFAMVRSSLMILLGFIIILITFGVTILFSTKFQENLEELQRRAGKVAEAAVNPMGVVGSAFMLGLNNMHRRRIRTGLTCGTLTLLIFAMICFTTVQNDIVDESYALGSAPYQGLLIKAGELVEPTTQSEVLALQEQFGERYAVCPRKFLVGMEHTSDLSRQNPDLEAIYERGQVKRKVNFDSVIQFTHAEPLRRHLQFITEPWWFSVEDEDSTSERFPVLIPDGMARRLGIVPHAVNQSEVFIRIGGRRCRVMGIFEATSLTALRDLDGRDILPFDIEAMEVIVKYRKEGTTILANDDVPRISSNRIILAPMRELDLGASNAQDRTFSVAVAMAGRDYQTTRAEIDDFLEQKAAPVYYGLDGGAYKGWRTREMSLAGLIDLLVPLLLASLTVLNTIRGSVFERRDEIYVYNAVGIAPRFVFFIFFAESLVYVVVGSLLGYLLSQGTGRILTAFELTGGMNMTYTSVITVYASIALGAVVSLSTWFPARTAAEIATPSEDAGWSLPRPTGDNADILEFDLPFIFTQRERIAVLAFFDRYLRNQGEGSSGRFFSGIPEIGVEESSHSERNEVAAPFVSATIWLKPFDLGVSQQMKISLPEYSLTEQFRANITLRHLSGTRESWLRLNHSFVALIRRHFLHWRVVGAEEREELLQEAIEKLKEPPTDDAAG